MNLYIEQIATLEAIHRVQEVIGANAGVCARMVGGPRV